MAEPSVAEIVKNALLYYENELYQTLAYCIMPNHVHWLFDTSIQQKNPDEEYKNLPYFMQIIKGYSANKCNELLGREGYFWQRESHDRVVRNDKEQENMMKYIYNNRVKAFLVENPQDWKYNFCDGFF